MTVYITMLTEAVVLRKTKKLYMHLYGNHFENRKN